MIDIAEAIDVALTLLRAAVWMAAGIGLACTGLVLLCVWAVTGGVKAARKRVTGARRRAQGGRAGILIRVRQNGSGALLGLRSARVGGAPLVDRSFDPQGGPADLGRLWEVGDPVHEVVDALPVDVETCRDLVRREVSGEVHVSKIAPSSSPSTGSLGVVQLLQRRERVARNPVKGPRRTWTDHNRWMLAAETGFACAYCQVVFGSVARRPGQEPVVVVMEADHFTPFAWTGSDAKENYVAACQICNGLKQDLLFDSVINARRHLDRLWVKAGYVIEFIPTRSHFEDPEGWAKEYARYLRTIGVRQDAE